MAVFITAHTEGNQKSDALKAALHPILTFKLFKGRLMTYQHRYGDLLILYLI